jgi:hypothetical protein
MFQDKRPLKSQINAIIDECDYDQVREIYEFCKQFKAKQTTGTITRAQPVAKREGNVQVLGTSGVDIDYLCGRWMHKCGQVADWLYESYYKDKRPHDRVLTDVKICYAAALPLRLVAVRGADCIGTLSIVKHYHEGEEVPLISLAYVENPKVNEGVNIKLLERAIRELRGLGYKEAFIKSEKALNITGRGYQPVEGTNKEIFRVPVT